MMDRLEAGNKTWWWIFPIVLKGPIIWERMVWLPSMKKKRWDLLCVTSILKPIRPMLHSIFNNQMAMAEGRGLAKT